MKWYRYHNTWPHLAVLETPGEAPPSWFGCRDEDWHRSEDEALKARLRDLRMPIAQNQYTIDQARKSLTQFEESARSKGMKLPEEAEL